MLDHVRWLLFALLCHAAHSCSKGLAVEPQLLHIALHGRQHSALRALLRCSARFTKISQEELACLAGISISTLRRLELGDVRVGKYAYDQVLKALQADGISFVGSGLEAEFSQETSAS